MLRNLELVAEKHALRSRVPAASTVLQIVINTTNAPVKTLDLWDSVVRYNPRYSKIADKKRDLGVIFVPVEVLVKPATPDIVWRIEIQERVPDVAHIVSKILGCVEPGQSDAAAISRNLFNAAYESPLVVAGIDLPGPSLIETANDSASKNARPGSAIQKERRKCEFERACLRICLNCPLSLPFLDRNGCS
jgi:hypothetical protein